VLSVLASKIQTWSHMASASIAKLLFPGCGLGTHAMLGGSLHVLDVDFPHALDIANELERVLVKCLKDRVLVCRVHHFDGDAHYLLHGMK
jgi:hypothetical protein